MKKLGSFDDYLNEKDDSLNESVLMSGIGTALAIYGMVKAFVGQEEKGEEK